MIAAECVMAKETNTVLVRKLMGVVPSTSHLQETKANENECIAVLDRKQGSFEAEQIMRHPSGGGIVSVVMQ